MEDEEETRVYLVVRYGWQSTDRGLFRDASVGQPHCDQSVCVYQTKGLALNINLDLVV